MKRVIYLWVCGTIALGTQFAGAQSVDEARMNRDIAVAENVLSTLIKQEFDKRNFFPIEVHGSYKPGYGVIFSIPTEMLLPMVWRGNNDFVVLDGSPGAYSYSYSWSSDDEAPEMIERLEAPEPLEELEPLELAELERSEKEMAKSKKELEKASKDLEKATKELKRSSKTIEESAIRSGGRIPTTSGRRLRMLRESENTDSLRLMSNAKIIESAKNFIIDYGDMISQLSASEKIIVTNKSDNQRRYFNQNEKTTLISVEATKGDLLLYRQGKLTREQMLSKLKVTNTESTGKVEPDLELLTSIFNRLYRNDLSQNFFIEGNAYYERLSDYGAIVYMQVYSSNQVGEGLFNMPTVNLREIDQATRDKKVKELYPAFESELKENVLEYGRTVRSLKDDEQLVFKIILTRCKGCGIPSDIEVSIKNSVLKDYNLGKLNKASALEKVTIKKGASQ